MLRFSGGAWLLQAAGAKALQGAATGLWMISGRARFSSGAQQPTQEQQQQQQQEPQALLEPPVYAAVVLERLPVVRAPPPEWEAAYHAWAERRRQQRGFYKQYPAQAKKASRQKEDDRDAFKPVPIETPADRIGDTRTMKRCLREKLVLLVKQNNSALGGGSDRVGGGGGGAGRSGWAFPHVRHQPGETVRGAAERALRECAGVAEVFFIGNAPMAHYPLGGGGADAGGSSAGSSGGGERGHGGASRALHTSAPPHAVDGADAGGPAGGGSGGAVFFMLAQAVNDPWDVELDASFASDHAWVAADELPRFLGDGRLAELAQRML